MNPEPHHCRAKRIGSRATAKQVPRREVFGALAGAAAGMAAVNDIVAAENNPATQVADRTSSIRITGLKARWVGPIVYVKIETNHGVTGWGDLKGVDPRPAKVLVESLFELLDGENPTRIEHLYPDNAGFNSPGITRMEYQLDKDGTIGLPPGPGLGVGVDEQRLDEESRKPQTYRWPGAKLKDGSVADY